MTLSQSLEQFEALAHEWWEANKNNDDAPDITLDKENDLYAIAYGFYQDQEYQKSIDSFRLLTALKPFEQKYWKGLGASLQMNEDYEQAIESYFCAQILSKSKADPYLYVYASDCYFTLGQIQDGLKALEGAKLSASEQKNAQVLKHVAIMRERWSNKNIK
ncbi:MAG: tetratricopeptide repeat protein [Parachlamydiaceae bacterium]|nr:tetratricopeptide repeat protein [Parachlamydiaceae bacterium]